MTHELARRTRGREAVSTGGGGNGSEFKAVEGRGQMVQIVQPMFVETPSIPLFNKNTPSCATRNRHLRRLT